MPKHTTSERDSLPAFKNEKPYKRARKNSSKASRRPEMDLFHHKEVAFNQGDHGAEYDSDYSSTGAYTPFSTLSFASKTTRATCKSKRLQKAARKQYYLRQRSQSSVNGRSLRSLP